MKTTYLSSSTVPSRTANSIHVMKMCQAFAKNGHEVKLIATDGKAQSGTDIWLEYGVEQCFKVEFINRPKWGRLGSIIYGRKAAQKAKQSLPDLFYGRCPHSLAWASKLGVPFIYEAHNLPQGFMRKRIESFLFSREAFNRLVVITESLKRAYLDKFPELNAGQIVVAHDGADVVNQVAISEPVTTNNPMKVGYAGSLYPGKGMEIILALGEAAPDYEYHIVGGNGPLEKWRAEAPHNVVFHGHVRHAEVSQILSQFDVLLLPMQRIVQTAQGGDIGQFTSPLKLFEYMAVKRPIVASKLPIVEEVLEQGKTCLFADPDDILEWKSALEQLKNSHLRESIASEAYKSFLLYYTWCARASRVLQGQQFPKIAGPESNTCECAA